MTANRQKLLWQGLDLIQRRLWSPHDGRWPYEISHYTPLEAFKSIVRNRELWLTHQSDLGATESGEMRHANRIINAELNRRWLPKSIDRHNSNFWGLGSGWHHYCVCFCRSGARPYMWQFYAGNGNGCAIVFSFSGLVDRSHGGQEYWIGPMLYSHAAQSTMAARMLRRSWKLSKRVQIRSDEKDEFWGEVMIKLALGCGLRFKREKFSHELEVRLGSNKRDETEQFMCGGKRRIRVPIVASTVCRVIRGPDSVLSLVEVQDFLYLHGWNVPVVEASPY